MNEIESVLKQHKQQLLKLPNVIGIGIGEKGSKQVIVVFVKQKMTKSSLRPQDVVPKRLGRYETDVRPQIWIGRIHM